MNWSSVIQEIQAHGLTQVEIASAVETSQGHISDLLRSRRGRQVGYQLGLNLISLRDKLARRAKRAA